MEMFQYSVRRIKKNLFRYYDEMEAMENEIMESGQKV